MTLFLYRSIEQQISLRTSQTHGYGNACYSREEKSTRHKHNETGVLHISDRSIINPQFDSGMRQEGMKFLSSVVQKGKYSHSQLRPVRSSQHLSDTQTIKIVSA